MGEKSRSSWVVGVCIGNCPCHKGLYLRPYCQYCKKKTDVVDWKVDYIKRGLPARVGKCIGCGYRINSMFTVKAIKRLRQDARVLDPTTPKVTIKLIKQKRILPDSKLISVGDGWFKDLDNEKTYQVKVINEELQVMKIKHSSSGEKAHRSRDTCTVCGDIRIVKVGGSDTKFCLICKRFDLTRREVAAVRKKREAYKKKHGIKDKRFRENRNGLHWKQKIYGVHNQTPKK